MQDLLLKFLTDNGVKSIPPLYRWFVNNALKL